MSMRLFTALASSRRASLQAPAFRTCATVPASINSARERQTYQLPRFYLHSKPLTDHGSYQLDADDSKHLNRVLRCRIGDIVELVDGLGGLQKATVAALSKSAASVSAVGPVTQVPPTLPQIDLVVACGGLKGGRSDWLVEKASELGASSIVALLTANSQLLGSSRSKQSPNTVSSGSGRIARWNRVATAGMKQSLRAHRLAVGEVWDMDRLLRVIDGGAAAFVGVEGGRNALDLLSTHVSHSSQDQPSRVLLVVGPEGDFSKVELQQLAAAGAHLVGLGPLRLRTETAALALLSAAMLHTAHNPVHA